MSKITLNLDEILFVRGVLRHGFIRDLHPIYRANATPETFTFYDEERAKADRLLGRLDARINKILAT